MKTNTNIIEAENGRAGRHCRGARLVAVGRSLKQRIYMRLYIEPTHKLLLAAGADCILELAAMFCAQ